MQRLAVELDALSGCMDLWKLVIKILCLVLEGALFLFCVLVTLLFYSPYVTTRQKHFI